MKKIQLIMAGVVALVASSCSTPKNIAYFQDLSEGQQMLPASVYDIRVRPEDKISIVVSTQDPSLSGLLNLVTTQNHLSANPTAGRQGTGGDSRVSLYTVDYKGDIHFPVLGTLHIAGMKRSEVAEFIEKKLIAENLVKEPIVTVEFINTGVSVLGEVARPGRYEFNRDHMTIIDAITMAGDLKNTGQRENVMVIREGEGGKKATYFINLTDSKSVTNSPAYYLQQEDIVYVEPNDKAKRETTSAGNSPFTPAFWLSVTSSLIGIATFIITLTKL